jgi:hypothetical protein
LCVLQAGRENKKNSFSNFFLRLCGADSTKPLRRGIASVPGTKDPSSTGEPLWLSGKVVKIEKINEIERTRVRSPPRATSLKKDPSSKPAGAYKFFWESVAMQFL